MPQIGVANVYRLTTDGHELEHPFSTTPNCALPTAMAEMLEPANRPVNGFHPLIVLASVAGVVIGGAVADTFLQGVGVISASVGLVSIAFTLRAGRKAWRRAPEIAYDSAVWGVSLGILVLALDAILG